MVAAIFTEDYFLLHVLCSSAEKSSMSKTLEIFFIFFGCNSIPNSIDDQPMNFGKKVDGTLYIESSNSNWDSQPQISTTIDCFLNKTNQVN